MRKKMLAFLLAMTLVLSSVICPTIANAAEDKVVNLSFQRMKEVFGEFLSKLNGLDEDTRSKHFLGIKVAMAYDTGIDILAEEIRNGEVFKSTLDMLEAEGISKGTVADCILLFKIWDADTRLAYIEDVENEERETPIDEEIALYEEIINMEEFEDLEGILAEHNVDLGTLVLAAGAIKIANDGKPIFTDDKTKPEDFALKSVAGSIKSQVDGVLSGYTINGMDYTSFDTMANVYIDKINERYDADRKGQLKAILEERDLYEELKDSDGDSGGGGGGGSGGGSGGGPDDTKDDDDAKEELDKIIDDSSPSEEAKEDAGEKASQLITDAAKRAGKKVIDEEQIVVKDGKAEVEIEKDIFTEAFENIEKVVSELEAKAKDAGLEINAEKVVTIIIPKQKDVNEVTAKVPSNILEAAKDKEIDRIEVDMGIASISITPEALEDAATDNSGNIEMSVAQVDKTTLSEKAAAKVGDQPVFEFNLSVDGQKVSSFKGKKPVKISFAYELAKGEEADKMIVYYINDEGELEAVKHCQYDSESDRVTFVTNHFSRYTVKQTDVTFEDIAGNWGKTYIEALAGRKIVDGIGDNQFAPDGKVTRAQFIKMLMFAFDLIDENAATDFSDVPEGAWYYEAVASAHHLGITDGVGDNKFGVDNNITRQDMATLAYKTAQIAEVKLERIHEKADFADSTNIADYAAKSITAMQRTGIINGVGDGLFLPDDNATRAQAAKIIYLLYKGM